MWLRLLTPCKEAGELTKAVKINQENGFKNMKAFMPYPESIIILSDNMTETFTFFNQFVSQLLIMTSRRVLS